MKIMRDGKPRKVSTQKAASYAYAKRRSLETLGRLIGWSAWPRSTTMRKRLR